MIRFVGSVVTLMMVQAFDNENVAFLGQEEESEDYTQDDFESLMPYLYQTCDGPSLVRCGAAIEETSETPDEFFIAVDKCLKYSDCLTYHQILLFNEKQMGLDLSSMLDPSEDSAPKNIHDL